MMNAIKSSLGFAPAEARALTPAPVATDADDSRRRDAGYESEHEGG